MLDNDELPERPNVQTLNSVLSGLIGGLAGLAVGHPFDTVKVRLQSRELASRYKGTLNCFISTIKQEKFIGLYKGMASPAVGVGAVNALVFGTYTYFMQHQARLKGIPYDESNAPLQHVFLAGMGSGIVSSFVTCPMELAKVQLQNQTSTVIKGPLDCLHKMYITGGLRYCFKGMTPTMLRELSFGPYFVTYEIISRQLHKKGQELSGPCVILAGGTAGIAAWCSTYFADVVKTRIQSEPHRYKGLIDCMKRSYYEEGWRIFFKGLTPTILRAFPSNAATFAAYTWVMNVFQSSHVLTQKRTYEEAIL